MEDQGDQTGVGVEVLELAGDVAVVDIDRYRPDLEAGHHGLDVLGPVGQLHPDTVAWAHPHIAKVVGQPVGSMVELCVGQPAIGRRHRLGIADFVGYQLEQIGQIELHPHPSRRAK